MVKPETRLGREFCRWLHAALDIRRRTGSSNLFQIKKILQIQPEFGIRLEIPRQAQCRVRGYAAPLMHDLANPSRGDVQIERELVDGQIQGLHEIFAQDFAGMDRRLKWLGLLHDHLSFVIIHNLHVITMAIAPDKADAPLIVNANRMLARSATPQCFQPVTGRRGQNPQFCCGV